VLDKDRWQDGKITFKGKKFDWKAKVYPEGSKYGIDGGPVSKLIISTDPLDDDIWVYDRGWRDPKPPEELLKAILKKIK